MQELVIDVRRACFYTPPVPFGIQFDFNVSLELSLHGLPAPLIPNLSTQRGPMAGIGVIVVLLVA